MTTAHHIDTRSRAFIGAGMSLYLLAALGIGFAIRACDDFTEAAPAIGTTELDGLPSPSSAIGGHPAWKLGALTTGAKRTKRTGDHDAASWANPRAEEYSASHQLNRSLITVAHGGHIRNACDPVSQDGADKALMSSDRCDRGDGSADRRERPAQRARTSFDPVSNTQADQCRQRSICRDQSSKTYKPTTTATLPPSRRKPSIDKSQTVVDRCNHSLVVEAPSRQASRNVTAKDCWESSASRREIKNGYALRARFALVDAGDPGANPGGSTRATSGMSREEKQAETEAQTVLLLWLHPRHEQAQHPELVTAPGAGWD